VSFYLRKSLSVGPFKFNLSKSGVGLSNAPEAGGLGNAPRGTYVHIGRGGIYFRQALPRKLAGKNEGSPGIELQGIESASTSQMVDSSSSELLQQIQSKRQIRAVVPSVASASLLLILLSAIFSPLLITSWLGFFCAVINAWAFRADKLRKTVALFYEFQEHSERAFQNLYNVFASMRACSRMWHIESGGSITSSGWKVNAGASAIVKRRVVTPHSKAPPYFECNIAIPVLPAGRQRLYFFPDRLLVWDTDGVGAIRYEDLHVEWEEQSFIEDGAVPHDAKIVNKTWRYVNKEGGPDRRFTNNRELPVVLYEAFALTSKSGLNEVFQVSKTGIGPALALALKELLAAIAKEEAH
jgi:hypothetical protein